MKISNRFLRTVAILLACMSLLTLFSACGKKEKPIYKKEFPNVNKIEYDLSKYLKAPKIRDIVVHKKRIDNAVSYALISLLLEDAERTDFKDKDSTDVALYDTVTLHFKGVPADTSVKLDEDTLKSMDNTSAENGSNLVIGSGMFIGEYVSDDENKANPSFEDQLIGMKVGETKDIVVTFPDNYPSSPKLEGLPVKFTVTILSLSRPTLGELTDGTCKKKTGYETVEKYKEYLVEYYSGSYAYDAVYASCEIIGDCKELIDVYVDKYVHDKVNYSYGKELTEEDYKEAYADLYESVYDDAYTWAKSVADERVILKYLFDSCNITYTDKEFEERLASDWEANKDDYSSNYGIASKEEFLEYFGKDEVELSYMFEKTLKILPDFVNIK